MWYVFLLQPAIRQSQTCMPANIAGIVLFLFFLERVLKRGFIREYMHRLLLHLYRSPNVKSGSF